MSSLLILSLNLYSKRQEMKLSMEELAFRCSISTRYYGDIERGKCNPTLEILDRIATATSTSVAELLTEKTKGDKTT